MEQAILKVVWRFAAAMHGALCVMTLGEQLMQVWPVDNLDLVDQVSSNFVPQDECFDINYSGVGGGGGGGGGGNYILA